MQDQQQQLPVATPTLILGMIGFSGGQQQAVEQLLARRTDPSVRWRIGALADADAWWANGARTQLLADGSLRVGPGDPDARSVRLSLLEIDRPVAFAEPLANGKFEPALSFRFTDPASIHSVLTAMQTRWLAVTVAHQWLAGRLLAAVQKLTDRIYHVESRGRLLAVIDPAGTVGLAPRLTVQDLEDASWIARPSAARFLPPSFHQTTVAELMHSHAQRTASALLPGTVRRPRVGVQSLPGLYAAGTTRPPRLPQVRA